MPFPSAEHYFDPRAIKRRLHAGAMERFLQEHPDGMGVLLPKMKKEIAEDRASWKNILAPAHDLVKPKGKGEFKESVAHGVTEYWIRVMAAAAGVPPNKAAFTGALMADPGIDEYLAERYKKKIYKIPMEEHLLKSKNLSERIRKIKNIAAVDVPEPIAEKIAKAWPDLVRGGIAMSNIMERALEYGYGHDLHRKDLYALPWPTELDALREILQTKIPVPHKVIAKFAKPEELEAIYRVHRRFLDLFPELFEEKKSPFEEFIPEDRRKELEEVMELENRVIDKVLEGKLKLEDVLPERKHGKLIPLKPEHYKPVLERQEQTKAKKVEAKTAPRTRVKKPKEVPKNVEIVVRKEKEPFTIDDVDMNRVEKHPETGLPIMRNGDQIVVLPPTGKHPKELPHVNPEAVPPKIARVVGVAVEEGARPEDLEKYGRIVLDYMRRARERLMRERDRKPGEIMYDMWRNEWLPKKGELLKSVPNKGSKMLVTTADDVLLNNSEVHEKFSDYTHEHLINEIGVSEVALMEAIKVAKDMLKHPEKYGVYEESERLRRRRLFEKLEEMFRKKGKVVGFPHRERLIKSD